MRDPAYRLKLNKLFILGAGASFSATQKGGTASSSIAPLDIHFCSRIFNLDYMRPKWVSETTQKIIHAWADHKDFQTFGLESAIIRQLSHMKFFDAINKRRRVSCTQSEYINNIAHLITFVLKKAKESSDMPYRRMTSKLFPIGGTSNEAEINRIITFNYDDLLDNHLLARFSPERIYFDHISRNPGAVRRRRERFPKPLLVKLHGSVNWLCSTEEFLKLIDDNGGREEELWVESVRYAKNAVPSPSDNESPCIIPPIPDKPITRISLFKFLWSVACEYLHEAEEIVICGYSLPETDSMALSLFGNLRNERLKKVTVIDPNPAILARWRDLLIRPGVSSAQWVYHSDFSEYVEHM